jgi:gamma-glutamylcyclotransferase (GGCT)/AIG2-like uncharacterized protein YtfP
MEESGVPLFAYGSLLNLRSFERTIGRSYTRFRPICFVPGWRRCWNNAMPNEGFYEDTPEGRLMPERITYLNVRPSPDTNVNGVVYFLDRAEIELIDAREWTYDRICVHCIPQDSTLRPVQAYLYVAKREWLGPPGRPRTWVAIRNTYLNAVTQGVDSLGAQFKAGYIASTDPIDAGSIIYDETADDVFEI